MNQKNSLGLNSCFLDIDDPINLFHEWMEEAKKTEPNDPNAVALATSDKNNIPLAMFGVGENDEMPYMWMLGTDRFPKVARRDLVGVTLV